MKAISSFVSGLVLSIVVFSAMFVYAAADNVVISSVGVQVGVIEYGTAGTATFLITATGDANYGDVDWSISGVPGGVLAGFSDNPSSATGTWTTTLTLSTDTLVTPGSYPMTITADGDGVGADDTETVTLVVSPRTITLAGLTAEDKVYDNTPAATITGSLSDLINGDTVTATGAFADELAGVGKTVVVTFGGPDASYYTATSTLVADITKKDISIVAGDFATNGRPYDGTTVAELRPTPNGLVLAGVVLGDVVNIGGGMGSFADKHVGNGKTVTFSGFTATGTDGMNYNLIAQPVTETQNINPRSITVRPVNDTKVYDGSTTSTAVPQVTGGTLAVGDTGMFTQAFDTPVVGVGKSVISVGTVNDGNGGANYIITHQPRHNSAITPLAITIAGVTINDKIYDGNVVATLGVGGTLHGVIAPDSVVPDFSGATASYDTEHAGTGKTVAVSGVTLVGADAFNYTLTQPTVSGTILPRPISITAVTDTKAYDATTTSAGIPTLSLGTLVLGDSAVYTQVFDTKQAGTGKSLIPAALITDGNGGANYVVTAIPNTTGVITPIALSVTATGVNKVYDGTASATVTFADNRLAGDILSATGTATFVDKHVGVGKAITVTGITLQGPDAMNYVPNVTTTTTADITARTLTVDISADDKVYDGTRNATITLTDDRIVGDDVVLTYPSAGPNRPLFNNRHVGANKSVSVSGIALVGGSDFLNYTLGNTTASDTPVSITPAPLGVAFTADSKIYDGNVSAVITSATMTTPLLHPSDEVALATGTATFADKMVGISKTVTAVGFTVTGAQAGNYMIAGTSTTLADITARPLVVTATSSNKVYDGTDGATVFLSDDRVSGDVFTISGTGTFSDKFVGTGKTVFVTGITLTGIDGTNYTANATTSTTADITARNLTVGIMAADKVFDGTTVANVAFNDNRILGDTLSVTGTASFADANPGTAKLVTASGINLTGIDAMNYVANSIATNTATITEAVRRSGGGGGTRVRNATTTPTGTVLGVATSSPKFIFLVDLRLGSTHPDVTELQKVLIAQGYLKIAAPTGYFGSLTFEAVKAYQAAHPEIGYVTGFFGPLTRGVMNK